MLGGVGRAMGAVREYTFSAWRFCFLVSAIGCVIAAPRAWCREFLTGHTCDCMHLWGWGWGDVVSGGQSWRSVRGGGIPYGWFGVWGVFREVTVGPVVLAFKLTVTVTVT